MSFLNIFRGKTASFIDPLEQAHTHVTDALDVFSKAKEGLHKAVAHFESVKTDAEVVIGHYLDRKNEAQTAADNATTVLGRIEALLK
jgi:hypothetical protein